MSWVRADEGRLRPQGETDRVERYLEGSERRRLGDLAPFGGRRDLSLGEAVDLVVEEQDGQVHVPPQSMYEVVPSDRQTVPITDHDPHVQVGTGDGKSGGDGRCSPVDRVHAVGVHVVGESRGAPDARDEHGVLSAYPELGQQHLHRGENRVVATSGAPPHLLVGGPVLARGGWNGGACRRGFAHQLATSCASTFVAGASAPSISSTASSI